MFTLSSCFRSRCPYPLSVYTPVAAEQYSKLSVKARIPDLKGNIGLRYKSALNS